MSKLRWGIPGTARIATETVIPAIERSELGESESSERIRMERST